MLDHCTRPLRIGLLVPYDLAPHAGGVRQHAYHLKRALERGGDLVALIGPTSRPERAHQAHGEGVYALPGVVTVPVNGTQSAVGMLVSPWALLRLCRRLKLDVLHLHEPQVPTMSWGLCWWLRGVAKVATFHAADENNSIHWLRQISGSMVYRFIDRGIAVSKAAEQRTKQTWPRPLAVIPNGVCTSTFRSPSASPPARSTNHFLFVGALGDSRKGARVMLEAFAQAQAAGLTATLTMVGRQQGFAVGDLPQNVTLREGLTDLELAACYRRCDALVAPAIGRESFGMILLEAMASSKPVIASNIAGYREVANPAGTLFVLPNEPASLAQALMAFSALPLSERARMGRTNAQHAERYDWAHIAAAIRAEYVAALAGRGQTVATLRAAKLRAAAGPERPKAGKLPAVAALR